MSRSEQRTSVLVGAFQVEHWFHAADVVRSIAAGILRADPFFWDYTLPPDFSEVVQAATTKGLTLFPDGEELIKTTPDALSKQLYEFLREDPRFLHWNEIGVDSDADVRFVDRYTPTGRARQFIDLEAVRQNIACVLRDQVVLESDCWKKLVRERILDGKED